MQNDTRHDAPALTVEDARALAARVAAVVEERDELRREIHDLRLIMAELEALRALLDHDAAAAMAVPAATNGSARGHAATAPPAVTDAAGEGLRSDAPARDHADDTRKPPADDAAQADDDPAARDRDETAAERRGETDAGEADVYLQNPLVRSEIADPDQAARTVTPESKTPGDNTELVTRPPADDRHSEQAGDDHDSAASGPDMPAEVMPAEAPLHTGETPAAACRNQATDDLAREQTGQRPPAESLMGRILTAIEQSDKPRRGWQIQKELGLPRMPSAELSRLVRRGFLVRTGEAIFGVAGRDYRR